MEELAKKSGACKIQLTLKDAPEWHQKLVTDYPEAIMESATQISLELPEREAIPAFAKSLIDNGAALYEIRILDGLEEWFMSLVKQK